jgi:hypothetical protein
MISSDNQFQKTEINEYVQSLIRRNATDPNLKNAVSVHHQNMSVAHPAALRNISPQRQREDPLYLDRLDGTIHVPEIRVERNIPGLPIVNAKVTLPYKDHDGRDHPLKMSIVNGRESVDKEVTGEEMRTALNAVVCSPATTFVDPKRAFETPPMAQTPLKENFAKVPEKGGILHRLVEKARDFLHPYRHATLNLEKSEQGGPS